MADTDLDDIIDFIRQLKRGFDKDLFQSKLDELAYVAETDGIAADDFHTLFKLWLNLAIPITKWIALGTCLVPQDRVEERSVDYAFRWLLANCEVHASFSRMAFLLDWLTAAMDSDSIDMAALDSGYEIIYSLLGFELLTPHALKIVYNLTKPNDVSRKKVLELLDHAKKREGKKNMYRQIQVLLGLFKSYRPECVPEDVPAISVHTSFKKVNQTLLARFKRRQERRNITTKERYHLLWTNPLNEGKKKGDPLVPNLEFSCSGAGGRPQEGQSKWTCLDFSDPVSLLHHVLATGVSQPARLRSLLCNQTGLTMLALCCDRDQALLQYDLHHLLTATFLDSSPHSVAEKADLARRLAALQRALLQPLPAVSGFLARYLPFWNESDYFHEILELCEWLSPAPRPQLHSVVECLSRAYLRAAPVEQCAILRTLTTMYDNLGFSCVRPRRHYLGAHSAGGGAECGAVLPSVAAAIAELCQKGLQASPEDMRVLYSTLLASESLARSCVRYNTPPHPAGLASAPAAPRTLALALPLLAPSAVAVDKVAAILLLYRKIFSQMKAANRTKDPIYIQQRRTLENYTADFLSCLYHEHALIGRKSGIIFEKLHPQLVAKLSDLIPNVDAKFSLRNGLAFAPYTYMSLGGVDASDATNKMCFETAVANSFPNLNEFLVRAVSELRV